MSRVVVGFDNTRDADGSTCDALRELIYNLEKMKSLNISVHTVQYPSCFSDEQLQKLKAILSSELLRAVDWTPGKSETPTRELVSRFCIRVAGPGTFG